MNGYKNIGIVAVSLIVFGLLCFNIQTQYIRPDYFIYALPNLITIDFFETKYLYLLLLLLTAVPVISLSFDQKVNFYSKWKYLFKGLLLVGIAFILWDIIKTSLQVWGFNPKYVMGYYLYNLPMEEVMFFIIIPFACVFIYECLLCYFPNDKILIIEPIITNVLIGLLFAVAFLNWHKAYTATTCLIAAVVLLIHYILYLGTIRSRFYVAFVVCLFPFILIDGALTGAFQKEAVVIYNPEEFLNLRLFTIPIEDIIYFIPLYLLNLTMYEQSRNGELYIKRKF